MNARTFIAVITIAVIGFALFLWQGVKPKPPCNLLAADETGEMLHAGMGIEVLGNTPSWSGEAGDSLRATLEELTSSETSPFVPATFEVVISSNGQTVPLTAGCGIERFVFNPDPAMVEAYEEAGDDADELAEAAADLIDARTRRIDAVVDSLTEQIENTDFSGIEPAAAVFTPVPLLTELASRRDLDVITVWSPFASTNADCLHFADPEVDFVDAADAVDAVTGCIDELQFGRLTADQVFLSVAQVANPSEVQLTRARNLATAICTAAVSPTTACSLSDTSLPADDPN